MAGGPKNSIFSFIFEFLGSGDFSRVSGSELCVFVQYVKDASVDFFENSFKLLYAVWAFVSDVLNRVRPVSAELLLKW